MISVINHDSRARSQWGRYNLPRYFAPDKNSTLTRRKVYAGTSKKGAPYSPIWLVFSVRPDQKQPEAQDFFLLLMDE